MADTDDSGDTVLSRLYTADFAISPVWHVLFAVAFVSHVASGVLLLALPADALLVVRSELVVVFLFAWLLLPVSIFFDVLTARERGWDTMPVVWVSGMLMFIANVAIGVVYLYLRHRRT